MKYIIHIGICGFGNQLLGFKELCIISKYLNRKIILPIFIPHGTIRDKNIKKYYNFNEIFSVEHFKKFYDCDDIKNIKNLNINNIYNIRSKNDDNITNDYLKNNKKYYNINDNTKINYLSKKSINNLIDLTELKAIDDDILVILGCFNTLKLSTCPKNGCLNKKCNIFNLFEEDYNQVTISLIYNKNIEELTNKFLKEKNLNDDYLAFHLRTTDFPINKTFKDAYNFHEDKVYQAILNYIFENNNLNLINKIFIALPPDALKIRDIKLFNSNKVILLNNIVDDVFILSIIELNICYRSKILITSPTNTPGVIKEHTRSSFMLHTSNLRKNIKNSKLDKCITELFDNNNIEILKYINCNKKK